MSSFYAEDFSRPFNLVLILGSLDAPPIWESDRWCKFVGALKPTVIAAQEPAKSEGCNAQRTGPTQHLVNYQSREWEASPPARGTFALWSIFSPSNSRCVREKRCP